MTHVEVIPDGSGVERLDERSKIPYRAANVPCMVVIADSHPVTAAQAGKSFQLPAGGIEFSANIDELVSVVPRFIERNFQPRRCLERRLRDRICVRQKLGCD